MALPTKTTTKAPRTRQEPIRAGGKAISPPTGTTDPSIPDGHGHSECEGNSRVLAIKIPADGDKDKALAHAALDPTVKASALSNSLVGPLIGTSNVAGTIRAFSELVEKVYEGDMRQADLMLVAQAYTLDALFADLLRRWQLNMGHNFQISESYLRLAMKAQSQARATWESLSKIKNPASPTFVRQANIANGPQQVNNGAGPIDKQSTDISCARETRDPPNELLEAKDG